VSKSVVKCGWVKCGEVLQYSDGLSNKVSNIIRRLVDNIKLLLIQGVPGGKDLTSGECSLRQTITI
jgi:hypothetical protein